MDEARIEEIVRKVFDKARHECPVHSRNALCICVADFTSLSSKTLERLYDKYIDKKGKVGKQSEHTINALCSYLNFSSYADYVEKNEEEIVVNKRKKNWKLVLMVSLLFGVGVLLFLIFNETGSECMLWKKDHFVKVDCSTNYNEKVVPMDPVRFTNLEEIEVDQTTIFFDEVTGVPLVWYYKSNNGALEFFTFPGLHPINGATLKAITPYIIQKYVPLHTYDPSSFKE
jgi:hypothetical protein